MIVVAVAVAVAVVVAVVVVAVVTIASALQIPDVGTWRVHRGLYPPQYWLTSYETACTSITDTKLVVLLVEQ